MTLHLSGSDIRELATDDVVLAAARSVLDAESHGRTELPPRIDVPSGSGFVRVMPAVLGDVMGVKVMTLAEGLGTRYLVLLYDVASGRLLGMFDADELTRLRTAAYTLVAGELLGAAGHRRLGLVGSGFEATGHLRLMARRWPVEQVLVYSRSAARREGFAARMSEELGIDVRAVETAREATGTPLVVLATKSREPVVDGADLAPGAVVLSIGSTRPDLRELDRATLARAGTLLVDDDRQVLQESGDVIDAIEHGALPEDRVVPAARAALDPASVRRTDGRDLLVFKSVGTALQDLSLARSLLDAARAREAGRDLGEICELKPFAGAAPQAAAVTMGGTPS
ncbi:ornithine cyclodeaminase family protein [Nonomuraea sp. K274]|uniref:Ornithine cyclodeaminase family protein n=1 Tax=Nonomuraea cypriaca TaxID=1187855 RepID=A0A931AHW5_9ACTN|nr:ornithine cyclodeaminase family protein [Nonomuraea cypriaca]MBF8191955.1 ornithine cyclodeaminase family protein [Nonomuraea cypriaca]